MSIECRDHGGHQLAVSGANLQLATVEFDKFHALHLTELCELQYLLGIAPQTVLVRANDLCGLSVENQLPELAELGSGGILSTGANVEQDQFSPCFFEFVFGGFERVTGEFLSVGDP